MTSNSHVSPHFRFTSDKGRARVSGLVSAQPYAAVCMIEQWDTVLFLLLLVAYAKWFPSIIGRMGMVTGNTASLAKVMLA